MRTFMETIVEVVSGGHPAGYWKVKVSHSTNQYPPRTQVVLYDCSGEQQDEGVEVYRQSLPSKEWMALLKTAL